MLRISVHSAIVFFFAVVVVFIFQRFSQQLTQGRNVTQGHERYTLHQVWGVETQTYSELGVKRYVIFELTGFGYEWTDGRTDGRTDGWTDGWMDGWMVSVRRGARYPTLFRL